MSDQEIRWYDQQDDSEARPHQWYLHGEPCTILAIGVRKGEKRPAVHRLRTEAGTVLEVPWVNGELPGVAYQVFDKE